MTGYFILLAFLVGIVAAIVLAVKRRKTREHTSGVHPEDEPPSPRVQ